MTYINDGAIPACGKLPIGELNDSFFNVYQSTDKLVIYSSNIQNPLEALDIYEHTCPFCNNKHKFSIKYKFWCKLDQDPGF